MKTSRIVSFLIGAVIVISGIVLLLFRNNLKNDSYDYNVKVTKWDNVYEGNNIHFYFMNKDNPNLVNLKNKYGFDDIAKEGANDLEKTLAIIKWVNRRAEVKPSAMESKKSVDEMLMGLESNKVISLQDYNNIIEEALTSVGIIVRVGEFRVSNNEKANDENSYSVLEVWSKAHGKWVMVDGTIESYLTKDTIPLSAVEMIKADLNNVVLENAKDAKKYFKYISKFLNTYTIKINNNKAEQLKSNSYITFSKDSADIQIETLKGYIPPTIFVTQDNVFNLNPEIVYRNDESDKIPTIILAKRNVKDDTEDYIKFTVGAFVNSYMVEDYYISINGQEYTSVKTYYDLSIPKGKTTVSISIDGKTTIRAIELENMKEK
ncbi:hypothetical protein J2Z44_003968 [Clostridium punense]|uniref:Lipoprotein n=1 Tax=Clostridium punense TaxID=1054297 RepID=A0ABS4K8M8_9CLOT|nr:MULTISPECIES: hypothetical protein [Clostridium]EQB89103.1 hypothetical protein M918_21940 [Clostridium sp. BL8]MBP2024113.1 hypothetical protein [Clostridium punense]